jgi:hypothetical protein
MFKITTYYVMRKRVVKSFLKMRGWRFRGQDPPCSRPQIIFVNCDQTLWMKYLTTSSSAFFNISQLAEIRTTLNDGTTVLITWSDEDSASQLTPVFEIAKDIGAIISACAWDTTHKAIKFHSQFKPSPYTERDIRYLGRFFLYFKTI